VDHAFLQALAAGMPEGSGVALGLDRLLMAQLGIRHIDSVLAFPVERA
jgi:lysyl-tRNA synthetase class 2